MAKIVGDYLKNELRTLTKAGIVQCSVVRQFEIFMYYSGLNGKKMQNYEDTAKAMRCGVNTVRKAVKVMQQSI